MSFFSNNFDIFHQFCDFSKKFPYLSQNFRRSRQKGILRVRRNTWWKTGLRLQSVTVFNNIWTLHKYLSDFWWESAARSSGLHSTCTRARFEKKTIVSRKHVSFIVMGLKVERKKFLTFDNFLTALLSKYYSEAPENQFDFFEQFWSSFLLWDPSKNCWDFLRKNFGTFVEAAFHVYRQTIWGETIFSIEYSSSYFSWLGEENILPSDNLVSALLTRLRFSVLEVNFEIFFLQFHFFSAFSGFEYELFPHLAENFSRSCQKCTLRVQVKNWWKIGFPRKCVTFFS